MGRGATITVVGMDDVIKTLASMTLAVRNRLTEAAARKALKPLVATARAGVPVGTGNLKKSIGVKKVRRSRNRKNMTLLVGARPGYAWAYAYSNQQHEPMRYAGPVEYGHQTKGGGFVPPAGFLRNAYNQHRATVIVEFASELRERIAIYLSERGK